MRKSTVTIIVVSVAVLLIVAFFVVKTTRPANPTSVPSFQGAKSQLPTEPGSSRPDVGEMHDQSGRKAISGSKLADDAIEAGMDSITHDLVVRMHVMQSREFFNTEDGVWSGWPLYSEEEKGIKQELQQEYEGKLESFEFVEPIADDLRESFWASGALANANAYKQIYRLRAMLELCQESNPDDERIYFALLDACSAGWPGFSSEKYRASDAIQRQVDDGSGALYRALTQYYDRILSRKSALDFSDLDFAVMYDLIHSNHIYSVAHEEVIDRANIRPDQDLSSSQKKDFGKQTETLATEIRKKYIEFALKAASAKNDPFYVHFFELDLGLCNAGMTPSGWPVFVASRGNLASEYQFWRRGQTFRGPSARQEGMVPARTLWQGK